MDTGLQKYRAFVVAADVGSIVGAAERMGYSVSSVSRMVADLETACGLRLFDRSKAGVSLTSDGERLISRARAIVAECDRFDDEAAAIAGAEVGTVRVGTIASVATHILPRVLQKLRRSHPGITCELLMGDYAEIESWIAEGRVDLGTVRRPASGDFESVALLDDEHVAVVPKGHPLAGETTFPIAAFTEEPFVALERGEVSEVASLFERNGMRVVPAYTVWDDYAVMAMVEAGLGIAILPSIMTLSPPYDVAVLPLDVPARRVIEAAWCKSRSLTAAATAFLGILLDDGPLRVDGQRIFSGR